MSDLDAQELAQLGLQYMEDAIVALLSRHEEGLSEAAIAEKLGLQRRGPAPQGSMVTNSILPQLVEAGRILWDGTAERYLDNPDKL